MGRYAPITYDGPREMFGELGFSEGQTDVFIVRMQDVTPQKYKFADSTTTPNTIDTPWTTVAALGAAEVEFDQLIGLAKEFECNTLHASGLRTFCVTNGPQTGVRYTVIITMFDGPFPTDDTGGLSVNLSWPTNVAGLPGWQAQGPFIGDTWQQAGRIPYVINEPWGMQVSQLDANGSLMDDGEFAGVRAGPRQHARHVFADDGADAGPADLGGLKLRLRDPRARWLVWSVRQLSIDDHADPGVPSRRPDAVR